MTARERARLVAVARGDAEPDVVIEGARVFSSFTKEWLVGDVAVAGDRIAGVGRYAGGERIDGDGHPLVPGLIDAHVHLESSKLVPAEFARVVVPRGTTTVVCDPHEIANVAGVPGVRWLLEAASRLPLDVFAMAPSCVPASAFESPGHTLGPEAMAALLREPGVIGVAEMMNFPGVVGGDAAELAKLDLPHGERVDGHAPGLRGAALDAYVAAGIRTDHEAFTAEEALHKRRRGMWVLIREASNAHNLRDLLAVVREHGPEHTAFCTDDREPDELVGEGHIDHMCRIAVAEGVAAEDVLLMASLHGARAHGLLDRGAIAPGLKADLVLLGDLREFRPALVLKDGRVVARDGRAEPFATAPAPRELTATMRMAPLGEEAFTIRRGASGSAGPGPSGSAEPGAGETPSGSAEPGAGETPSGSAGPPRPAGPWRDVRVIEIVPGQLITRARSEAPEIDADGRVVAVPARDLAKLAVVERHHATGRVGLGLVRGFGLTHGAFASTVAHDAHNLVVVGCDDASMLACARRVAEIGGGLAVAREGGVVGELALPVAGLLSDAPAAEVAAGLTDLQALLRAHGVRIDAPFMTLSFLALSVIPSLKLTDRGLVDVESFALVPLEIEHRGAADER